MKLTILFIFAFLLFVCLVMPRGLWHLGSLIKG